MKCTIKDAGEYFVKVIPYFNGEKRDDLISFIDEHDDFDPYGGFPNDYQIINNELIFEISKDYFDKEEYDKKETMYNETLRDLCDLHYANGLHTGRWEDEYAREESCKEYLTTMVSLAEKYHLNYNKNLENYIEDEDNPEYYAMETMGFELQEIVEKYLLEILIHKNG